MSRYEVRYVGDWISYIYDNESKEGIRISNEDFVRLLNKQAEQLADLETKLAESENQLQAPKEQILNILGSQCIQYNPNQEKISFAVEQIVKTKETLIKFLQDEGFYENKWYDLFETIDNQIEEIKKEMK